MRNGMTNHCKTWCHFTLLFILSFMTNQLVASSVSINVYLKLQPNHQVIQLINQFNRFLSKKGAFTPYKITPFVETYPLHVTLFLTHYDAKQLPLIIQKIKASIQQPKAIELLTADFIASETGYTMLTISKTDALQKLSDQIVKALHDLRDKKAPIPAWAAKNKKYNVLFQRYGSPSVFNLYRPHFSLFDPDKLTQTQKHQLFQKLSQCIIQFKKQHNTHVLTYGRAIGIGIADAHGQIIKELDELIL